MKFLESLALGCCTALVFIIAAIARDVRRHRRHLRAMAAAEAAARARSPAFEATERKGGA